MPFRHGPDDDAEPLRQDCLDDLSQAAFLLETGDLLGNPDLPVEGKEDEEPSGQRDLGGDAHPFLTDGLLRDLDDDFLPFFELDFLPRGTVTLLATGLRRRR